MWPILDFWAVLDCPVSCWSIRLNHIPVWNHMLIHSQVSLLQTLCSLQSYMVLQSALAFCTVNINKAPKTSLSGNLQVDLFTFCEKAMLKFYVNGALLILFQNSLKQPPHGCGVISLWECCDFHVEDAELWYTVITTTVQTTVKIEIGNLKRRKYPNGVEFCLELYNCLQPFLIKLEVRAPWLSQHGCSQIICLKNLFL